MLTPFISQRTSWKYYMTRSSSQINLINCSMDRIIPFFWIISNCHDNFCIREYFHEFPKILDIFIIKYVSYLHRRPPSEHPFRASDTPSDNPPDTLLDTPSDTPLDTPTNHPEETHRTPTSIFQNSLLLSPYNLCLFKG